MPISAARPTAPSASRPGRPASSPTVRKAIPLRSNRYAASAPHAASCSAPVSWNARSTRREFGLGSVERHLLLVQRRGLQQRVEQRQRAAQRREAERDRQHDEDLGADEPPRRRVGDHRGGGGPRRGQPAHERPGHDRTLPRGVPWPRVPAAVLPALDHVASAHTRRDDHVRPAVRVAVGARGIGHGQPAERRLRPAVAALRGLLRRDVVPDAAPGGAAAAGEQPEVVPPPAARDARATGARRPLAVHPSAGRARTDHRRDRSRARRLQPHVGRVGRAGSGRENRTR